MKNIINRNGIVYEANDTMSYCWKYHEGRKGSRVRISKFEYMEVKQAAEQEAIEAAIEAEAAKEIAVEVKKAKKRSRKSKDVAYAGQGVTLTAKQVDFIRHLPDTDFWDRGIDSSVWTDVLADQIGGQFAGKPMTVGAMISTLCEKGIAVRGKAKVNNRTSTCMALTDIGKAIALDLGLAD